MAGALTSVAALVSLAVDSHRQPLVSVWLVVSGIALAALSVYAMRGERAVQALFDERVAERDRAESARRAAETRSLEMAESSPDMLTVHAADGSLSHVSSACREMLGYEPEELIGRRPEDLVHPDDLPIALAVRNRARTADDAAATLRLRRRDDRYLWIEAKLRIVRDPETGTPTEAHAIVRDVHDRLVTQRALAEAEERFRTAFEEGAIGMAITGTDGRLLRVNHALCAITGHTPGDLESRPFASLLHPEDREQHQLEFDRMLRGELRAARGEKRYLHDEGHIAWVALTTTLVRGADGAPLHFLTQAQDVTERRRYEAELRFMADHDPLTGLLNRRAFERELERHVEHAARYGPQGAAILLDIDHFKNVNDTLGHGAGDELIAKVADALRTCIGDTGVISRLGGDEFAVLLPDRDRAGAQSVAHELLGAVRALRMSTPSGRLRTVSASVGIAPFDTPGLTGEDALVNADLAMYEAKEGGRDGIACYAAPKDNASRPESRLSWTDIIRDALDEDRFVLQAQPIVDLKTGDMGQFELLLRLRDPLGELISPAAFLPVAERYDMIGEIDRWVVARAIDMLGEERRRGRRLIVEVNISGRSTGDPELLALIEERLRVNDVSPSQVIFEITETTAVANIPRAQEFAGRLAALGCRFALDDFGAAFASFYYLKHLPFDYLKIDGEFVRSCADNRTDQLVIQAVVDIARGLGKRTVAEMVGDEETMTLLRDMGVDYAQGFYIGRPAPLAKWLVETRPKDPRRGTGRPAPARLR
jgi:diguanylate cyclase (GGDEF)-like protein/PAS domain S-box-containing protein